MQLEINDHRKIHAIQHEFNQLFPFLKIEFFSKPHKTGGVASVRKIHSDTKTLGECGVLHKKGILTVMPGMSVTELEANFRDVYGLEVRVYRKSGKIWLETKQTEKWSLEKQNMQGEAITRAMEEESEH